MFVPFPTNYSSSEYFVNRTHITAIEKKQENDCIKVYLHFQNGETLEYCLFTQSTDQPVYSPKIANERIDKIIKNIRHPT